MTKTATDDINARAMERYRRSIAIELTADDALHVTLNGVHTINDMTAFASALHFIVKRNERANATLGDSPPSFQICQTCTNPAECGSWQSCHNQRRFT